MIKTLVLSWSLCCGGLEEVSTDNIDAYVGLVVKARQACGPTSVWYCLRRLGHNVRLTDLWQEATIKADGTDLQSLLDLLHAHGVSAQAVAGDPSRLADLPVPAILVVDDAHCVVYEGLESDGAGVRYFEPSVGKVRAVPWEEMQRHWTGEAIVFGPPALPRGKFVICGLVGAACVFAPAAVFRWRKPSRRPAS